MLFDINSFFASCEQQFDPRLRNKPLVVVPSLTDSTSVIAASYEAKLKGIKTNTRVSDAKKMCPGLILKVGNHRLYTEIHHQIIKACSEILPVKKVLSIDEMAFELLGRERNLAEALKIAQKMKDHVIKNVGSEIKSSVGLGPNILIAKIASDMMKPNGLVAISESQILEKLGPLPIEVIPGVGRQMKQRLNQKSYYFIKDMLGVSEFELQKHWGSILGLRIAKELKGEDLLFRPELEKKSLGHEHILPPQLRNFKMAHQVALKLLMKALFRMREKNLKNKTLKLNLTLQDASHFENSISFNETNDTFFHTRQLQILWDKMEKEIGYKKPFKVHIGLAQLIQTTNGLENQEQLSFFDSPKSNQINLALDTINKRFGANSLYLANTHSVIDHAKTRISFNHVPTLEDEF